MRIKKSLLIYVFLLALNTVPLLGIEVVSPNKKTTVTFDLINGVPTYNLVFCGETLVKNSPLGLDLTNADLSKNLHFISSKSTSKNKKWKTTWGQREIVTNNYNELIVSLQNSAYNKLDIIFRVFDNGVGFRYVIKGQGDAIITKEHTHFNMASDNTAFWVPADFENDEYHYQKTRLSEVTFELFKKSAPKGHAKYHPCQTGFNTPLTMKTPKGNYLSINEAAIWNYPGFSLCLDTKTYEINTLLAAKNENKVQITLPFSTPWRVILLGQKASELVESDLILNLNEPCKLKNTSWIKPMKYVGIWWEMHVKKSSWELEQGKNHGATTENTKKYIDFAAKNGFGGVLVEGWNKGWENGWKNFDYTLCYPDFDIKTITDYAKSKGVQLIGHHETGGDVENYERQMVDAYKFYQKYGVNSVKTGYVGKIDGHYHYDQRMVNHYNSTVTKGAKHKISFIIHEPIKPSGICRTYPNLLSGEGMRGQEQNAWSEGNDVNHNLILPFTRNLAGPMDFTPGIFDIRFLNSVNSNYKTLKTSEEKLNYKFKYRVNTTLCQQLALYVVFYSPVQMAADLIENYENHPAFQFIVDVPVDWKQTKVLDAEIGEFIITTRQDRKSENWYLGAITNGTAREFDISLNFLSKKGYYEATIYRDGENCDYLKNPESYTIEKVTVSAADKLKIEMAAGGGTAIAFKKL
jgi:hypothetical protein